jgi:hypothetical protein
MEEEKEGDIIYSQHDEETHDLAASDLQPIPAPPLVDLRGITKVLVIV